VIAVDTNVVVRLLTNDHPTQVARAVALFRKHAIFVPKSVLLETEWVLRYGYGIAPPSIAKAFLALMGLPNVTMEDAPTVHQAIGMLAKGIDFADALHLASSAAAERFATFDAKLAKRARGVTALPVVQI
jgi:predicted nucleic-acid-binding protein